MDQAILESAKERLVQLYGTENCKRLIKMPSSESAFSVLKKNVEREYSKYKDELPEEQYQQFIEEIFETFKEYKASLEKAEERYYGEVYGDYAVKIVEVKRKYGLLNWI